MTQGETDAPARPEVVQALVDNHRQFLAFVERRVGSRELAEEIVQDAFARGLDRVDQVRSEDSALAWFYRVLRNAVTDSYRRRASADRRLEAFAAELETASPDDETGRAVCRCVASLASTLKPEYADALRRIDIEGAAVKDYALEQGISANNAAVRAFRARAALRKQVMRACGSCAEHGCLDCSCKH